MCVRIYIYIYIYVCAELVSFNLDLWGVCTFVYIHMYVQNNYE